MRIILATLALILSFGASAFDANNGPANTNNTLLPTTVTTQAADDEWGFPDPFDDMEGGNDDSSDTHFR